MGKGGRVAPFLASRAGAQAHASSQTASDALHFAEARMERQGDPSLFLWERSGGRVREQAEAVVAASAEAERAWNRGVEVELKVDRGVTLEGVGAEVTDAVSFAVVGIGGEGVFEVGDGAPGEGAGLFDAGVAEGGEECLCDS